MTPLRRKRLLLLAKYGGNCRAFYPEYCQLMRENEPPVGWCIGFAYLTDKGEQELK